ncbi:hypothetical protein HanXRQr2_Chr10g0462461 [Helianthus annuus]|uniref:Secreted protein n=1 Tax=Helianthus annuus TaxID=4232 RepID=A0A9K3I1M2_HELAN|nr:hypothetical protein HanXRQr2_Chr10g0462461 [Helianthus annuus]
MFWCVYHFSLRIVVAAFVGMRLKFDYVPQSLAGCFNDTRNRRRKDDHVNQSMCVL